VYLVYSVPELWEYFDDEDDDDSGYVKTVVLATVIPIVLGLCLCVYCWSGIYLGVSGLMNKRPIDTYYVGNNMAEYNKIVYLQKLKEAGLTATQGLETDGEYQMKEGISAFLDELWPKYDSENKGYLSKLQVRELVAALYG
jgi:hypothetical protein